LNEHPADEMSDEEKRRDQLTRMSGSTEADAAPRIVVSEGTGGAKRIDIAETAAVRPGDPTEQVPDAAPSATDE
jgi:hypothetical protein